MSVQDRDWYREDYERRRKQLEEEEKRKARQAGADSMWNEIEPQKSRDNKGSRIYQYKGSSAREKQLLLTCPNCERQFILSINGKRISSNSCRCPSCNRRITIMCETKTDKVITTGLFILGIPALLLIFFSVVDSILRIIG